MSLDERMVFSEWVLVFSEWVLMFSEWVLVFSEWVMVFSKWVLVVVVVSEWELVAEVYAVLVSMGISGSEVVVGVLVAVEVVIVL